MKARGVDEILITATDNLNGFTDTIRTVFSESKTIIYPADELSSG